LQVLSFTARQKLLFDDLLVPQMNNDVNIYPPDDGDSDWDDKEETAMQTLPPGEEGFFCSHAGGEATLQEIMEGMTFS